MKHLFIAFVALCYSLCATAQSPTNDDKSTKLPLLGTLQVKQINQLKEGVLLVRLKTKKSAVAALRRFGKVDRANRIEAEQAEQNRSIVAAFKYYFDFCPTYFFYSDQSVNVKENQLDSVLFLNGNLNPDSTIKVKTMNFFTAEFGNIEQDTAVRSTSQSYETNSSWSVTETENYAGGPNLGFGALVIKSDKFVQLGRPFPYYVRTFDTLPIKRKAYKVVRRMNKKLHQFHLWVNTPQST